MISCFDRFGRMKTIKMDIYVTLQSTDYLVVCMVHKLTSYLQRLCVSCRLALPKEDLHGVIDQRTHCAPFPV